jgi:transposase
MLQVDLERWQQSPDSLREQAIHATHARTRERLLALYEICQGKSATEVGRQTQRNPQTVMEWVHRYNEAGSEALVYRRTGGHPPLCLKGLYSS